MKRLYSTPEYKKYNAIRRRNEERRVGEIKRRREKRARYIQREFEEQRRPRYSELKPEAVERRGGRAKIIPPENFSIVENAEEMLSFFAELSFCARNSEHAVLDLSKMQNLTPDGILYMLSILDHFRRMPGYRGVSGNYPNDKRCLRLLKESGFFNYVDVPGKKLVPADPDVLPVRTDNLVRPVTAKDVIDFSRKTLQKGSNYSSKGMYVTLIECMANTRQHAYDKFSVHSKWWLIAVHEESEKKVKFSFLDNGKSIPNTIRKNIRERLFPMLARNASDADLVWSAMQGEFRTRTKKGYRGKGLPKIQEHSQSGAIRNLVVISREAFVRVSQQERINLKGSFSGTLFSWDFV